MAKMLYKFVVHNPSNVPPFPPSVLDSIVVVKEWLENEKNIFGTDEFNIPFDSEEELSAFLTRFTITDATLLADQATWNAEHGVSFTNEIYRLDLTDTNGII